MTTLEVTPQLGPQEPPDDPRIFNRKQADGSYRPLAEFFDRASALAAPADRLRLDDRVLITGGGRSGEYARVVYLYGDGRYDLLGDGLVLLVKYPGHILRKV